jgi:hypothetical protein
VNQLAHRVQPPAAPAAVAALPRPAPRYASPWKVWLPIVAVFVILDSTFNLWFWRIPRLSNAINDRGYQFHIDLHRLDEPKPRGSRRVVAFGSSVAGSFDPYQVQSLLEAAAPGSQVRVYRLLKPGMKPADYRLLFESERARWQPDAVVFTFNLVDFLNPSFERGFRPIVRQALPPWAVLRGEQGSTLTPSEKLDLMLAGVSNLYRYRVDVRAAARDHVLAAMRWLRAEAVRHDYGVYPDGYTKQHFGVVLGGDGPQPFDYYVDPEWIRQRGKVRLEFSADGRVLAQRIETEPGWKEVTLSLPPGNGARLVNVVADGAWNRRAAGLDVDARLLAVRLRDMPASGASNDGVEPFRYPPYDRGQVYPFLRLGRETGAANALKWERLVNAPTSFGARFRAYRDAKLHIRDEVFRPTGEYAEVQRLVRLLTAGGTAVILVNTPESPRLLPEYETTPYYQAYLQFFDRLAAQYPNVAFYDLRNTLPAEDFNDWHHVNYIGGIKLGPRYAAMLKPVVAEP